MTRPHEGTPTVSPWRDEDEPIGPLPGIGASFASPCANCTIFKKQGRAESAWPQATLGSPWRTHGINATGSHALWDYDTGLAAWFWYAQLSSRGKMDEDGILTMGLFDFLLDPDSLNM